MRPIRWPSSRAKVNRPSRRSSTRTRPLLESLESRVVLYSAAGNAWPHPQLITISFMPDGTNVGGVTSNLFSSFNSNPALAGKWQSVILAAAQLWAPQTNINFAVVPDNGTGEGSGNYEQGDPGFGDIRISGFDFGTSTLGWTSQPPPVNNFSVAGDLSLNTAQSFHIGTTYDLFTVAAHEFGHALGLDESTVSNAVEWSTYTGLKTQLAPDDIAGIRSLYGGARTPDAYNSNGSSDGTFATATNIGSLIDPTALTATVPNLDITTAGQVEDFTFTAPSGTSGPLTVTVQSAGLSLLAPKLTVYGSDHTTVLGSANGAGQDGATISTTISGVTPGQQFYVQVQGADTSPLGTGRYALSVGFTNPQAPSTLSLIPALQPGYAETGTLSTAGGGGVDGEYRFAAASSGAPTASASWQTTGLSAGTYDVQVTWLPYSNRADNTDYWIYDGTTPIKEVRLNQQVAPSGPTYGGFTYQDLGPVAISSGTLKVVLLNDADGYVIADAARVVQASQSASFIDDLEAGFSQTGTWSGGGGAGANGEYLFAAPTSGAATATASWANTGLATGNYDVQVTWLPYSNRADNAQYSIYDGTTLIKTVLVDQTAAPVGPTYGGVTYEDLGTVPISSGTLKVVLSNNADGYVIADATRIVPSIAIPNTAALDGNPLQTGGGSALNAPGGGNGEPLPLRHHLLIHATKAINVPRVAHLSHRWNHKFRVH